MQTSTHRRDALAAVDLGSNSFRLEIAVLAEGRYERLAYLKETVRLGAGLRADGLLDEAAVLRALDCLARFGPTLAGLDSLQVRAVATQTLREARDRDAFLQRAQDALGFAIEVISGREEARLIYAGVAHLQPSDDTRLVVDIGGRSTEMILGRGRTPLVTESFSVGCVGLSMRFFADGKLSADAFRAAQVAAGAELEEAFAVFTPERWQHALGSSGTASAVAKVLQAANVTDGRITPAALRWCISRCIGAGHVDALDMPGLAADRRAVLPAGLAILYTLMVHFEIAALWPAKGALRQGVIVDLHERSLALRHGMPGDMRDTSVAALQRRFDVDSSHALRVANIALGLFDAMNGIGPLDIEARRELAWACALHEIGLTVSHHQFHRHGAYLLSNVDAPGFSQSQLARIAHLVLGQRGGLRKLDLQQPNPILARQILCLRVAALKCHARREVSLDALTIEATEQRARLTYSPAWAQEHPRTLFLLNEEAEVWRRQGPTGWTLELAPNAQLATTAA